MEDSGYKIKHISAIIYAAIFFLSLLSCRDEQVKHLNIKRNFTGSLWIVRNSISTPRKVDQLLDMVKDSNIKNLFVQVRGRGDAYYNSTIELKGYDVEENFDPLSYLINKTRNTDIRIHAWINISYVMNPKDYPGSPGHVLAKHPDWATYDYTGRPITDYSGNELEQNLVEGYFLDPAVPGVKEYNRRIIKDIISRYDVDGIHLDYIRYPFSGYSIKYKRFMSDFGYNPIARKTFTKKYGIDPIKIDREKGSGAKTAFDMFRAEQINEIVKDISAIVKSKDKSIIVSAAVSPKIDISSKAYFQDWPLWLKRGYIDIACIMSYTKDPGTFTEYIESAVNRAEKEKILMGIMVNKDTTMKTVIDEIKSAYTIGTAGYIVFSFEHNKNFISEMSRIVEYSRYVYMLY